MRVPVTGWGRDGGLLTPTGPRLLSLVEAGCGVDAGPLSLLNGACDFTSCAFGPVLWSIGATIGLAVIGAADMVPPIWPPPPPAPPAASAFGAKAKLGAQAPARSVSLLEIMRGMFDFSFYGSIVCPAPSMSSNMKRALSRAGSESSLTNSQSLRKPAFSRR